MTSEVGAGSLSRYTCTYQHIECTQVTLTVETTRADEAALAADFEKKQKTSNGAHEESINSNMLVLSFLVRLPNQPDV